MLENIKYIHHRASLQNGCLGIDAIYRIIVSGLRMNSILQLIITRLSKHLVWLNQIILPTRIQAATIKVEKGRPAKLNSLTQDKNWLLSNNLLQIMIFEFWSHCKLFFYLWCVTRPMFHIQIVQFILFVLFSISLKRITSTGTQQDLSWIDRYLKPGPGENRNRNRKRIRRRKWKENKTKQNKKKKEKNKTKER